MILIIFAIFILILHIFYETSKDESAKKFIWVLACILTILIVAFRSLDTGADTEGYVRGYLSVKNSSWASVLNTSYRDPGYRLFIKALSTINSSSLFYLLVTSFLSFIGVFDIIKRNTEKPLLALFFFITIGNFLFAMTGIRQAIAMSMCLLSVRFIQDRKIIPFVILVWLGAQLHHSAYLFLVSYFLAVRKITPGAMLMNVIVTIVVFAFFSTFLSLANDILDYNYGLSSVSSGYIYYAIIFAIVIFGFVTRDLWLNTDQNNHQTVILNLAIICLILWTLRLISRTAERPSMYFLTPVPIVLVNCINALKEERTKLIVTLCSIAICLFLFAKRAIGIEYVFFWN